MCASLNTECGYGEGVEACLSLHFGEHMGGKNLHVRVFVGCTWSVERVKTWGWGRKEKTQKESRGSGWGKRKKIENSDLSHHME